jgi:hypothetical protein
MERGKIIPEALGREDISRNKSHGEIVEKSV